MWTHDVVDQHDKTIVADTSVPAHFDIGLRGNRFNSIKLRLVVFDALTGTSPRHPACGPQPVLRP
jgi:hypothetical protein